VDETKPVTDLVDQSLALALDGCCFVGLGNDKVSDDTAISQEFTRAFGMVCGGVVAVAVLGALLRSAFFFYAREASCSTYVIDTINNIDIEIAVSASTESVLHVCDFCAVGVLGPVAVGSAGDVGKLHVEPMLAELFVN
jgi:hypothetical protein